MCTACATSPPLPGPHPTSLAIHREGGIGTNRPHARSRSRQSRLTARPGTAAIPIPIPIPEVMTSDLRECVDLADRPHAGARTGSPAAPSGSRRDQARPGTRTVRRTTGHRRYVPLAIRPTVGARASGFTNRAGTQRNPIVDMRDRSVVADRPQAGTPIRRLGPAALLLRITVLSRRFIDIQTRVVLADRPNPGPHGSRLITLVAGHRASVHFPRRPRIDADRPHADTGTRHQRTTTIPARISADLRERTLLTNRPTVGPRTIGRTLPLTASRSRATCVRRTAVAADRPGPCARGSHPSLPSIRRASSAAAGVGASSERQAGVMRMPVPARSRTPISRRPRVPSARR